MRCSSVSLLLAGVLGLVLMANASPYEIRGSRLRKQEQEQPLPNYVPRHKRFPQQPQGPPAQPQSWPNNGQPAQQQPWNGNAQQDSGAQPQPWTNNGQSPQGPQPWNRNGQPQQQAWNGPQEGQQQPWNGPQRGQPQAPPQQQSWNNSPQGGQPLPPEQALGSNGGDGSLDSLQNAQRAFAEALAEYIRACKAAGVEAPIPGHGGPEPSPQQAPSEESPTEQPSEADEESTEPSVAIEEGPNDGGTEEEVASESEPDKRTANAINNLSDLLQGFAFQTGSGDGNAGSPIVLPIFIQV